MLVGPRFELGYGINPVFALDLEASQFHLVKKQSSSFELFNILPNCRYVYS
jgi:hypothetical protein